VLLTEASWGPETRRRMVVDDDRAAGAGGARGGSCCRGGRGPWLVQIGSGDSCGGGRGVREAWGSPTASNFGGGGLTRGGVPGEIRTEERAEVEGEGRWSSWVVRRC
jgi:hypothetical protein